MKYLFSLVWLFNGLYAKMLDGIPRHQEIVGEILGPEYAREFTFLIGTGELAIAVWILLGWWPRWCMWVQIGLVVTMNLMEFSLVPEFLLWGRLNLPFAILFAGFLYWAYHKYILPHE